MSPLWSEYREAQGRLGEHFHWAVRTSVSYKACDLICIVCLERRLVGPPRLMNEGRKIPVLQFLGTITSLELGA